MFRSQLEVSLKLCILNTMSNPQAVVCGMFRSQITVSLAWWFAECLGLRSLHFRHGGLRYV